MTIQHVPVPYFREVYHGDVHRPTMHSYVLFEGKMRFFPSRFERQSNDILGYPKSIKRQGTDDHSSSFSRLTVTCSRCLCNFF